MSAGERAVIRVAVFLGGAMLMALEISAFRIIGKTFGTALRETTAVIAVFLAAMSLGYWAGGRAGDRWPRRSTLVAVFLSAAATLLAVPPLDLFLSPRIAASHVELATHAFLATSVLFAIPAFLFASISPIAIRLFATTTGESGSTAGSISAFSTFGSIAGSVLTAFVLIDWLASITRTVIFIAIASCMTAAMLLPVRRLRVALAASVVLIVIPTAAFIQSARNDRAMLAPVGGWRVLYTGDSAYHHIIVRELAGKQRNLSFDAAVQSRMPLADPYGAGHAYTDAMHIARLMRPALRRILVIGLGGGTTPKQFVRYYDDTVVDVVDIDPLVVDVARRYFFVEPSERLRIHLADGRTFVRDSRERWDLIIIDAATTSRYGSTIPPHLVTREFLTEVASHLERGGVLHFHCAFGTTKLMPALEKTIGAVFASVLVTRNEILASDVALITTKETLAERARPLAALPTLSAHIAELRPVGRLDALVLTDDYAPVDALIGANR
ncbi:MAG TPA: fused MFS/spermidine synthase [Thermoanaerobaculia bacterium]|nr:fused MFS/spermidine synthase [Thermoanaerobaculia bacterium]